MRLFRLILAVLGPFLLMPVATAATKDWSQTVTRTAEGAHVIGNPAARTRLVEYVSYTCPHCAHFVAEGTAPLKSGWIAKGRVAVEIRNLVRDRYDLAAALLARCGGPARFPGNHEAIFAAFGQWMQNVQAYDLALPDLPPEADQAAALTDIADKTGLIAMMTKHGLAAGQSRACLADKKTIDMLMAMTRRAVEKDKVTGTPSFLINGKLTQAHDWESLRPLLPAPAN